MYSRSGYVEVWLSDGLLVLVRVWSFDFEGSEF